MLPFQVILESLYILILTAKGILTLQLAFHIFNMAHCYGLNCVAQNDTLMS